MDAKKKVIIGHPFLGHGGSESTVMWLIEALKSEHQITVLTTGGWDLEFLNSYYGTRVLPREVQVRIAPVPRLFRDKVAAAFRGACYARFARQVAAEYDLRISAYNFTDWGLPAIHFIADFSWEQNLRERFDPPSSGLIYRKSMLRRAYLRLAAAYAKPSSRNVIHDDRLIANSVWTARLIKEVCGVDCAAVVSPCVWTEFPQIPWEEKEPSFVMIGRITPEKQVERAITILETVRKRGHAVRFHLCGYIGTDRYGKTIAALCKKHADWIIPDGLVSGDRKASILARCRFGIQTRNAEPFGISVAEMVKAGAIVFAPADGGQAEILGQNDLLFRSVEDAVDKIDAVLSSPERQEVVSSYLRQRTRAFRTEHFIQESLAAITRPETSLHH